MDPPSQPSATETDPDARAVAADAPPARLGLSPIDPDTYEVLGEIARGGMGRILRARDRRLDRLVAIKQLIVRSPRLAAMFEREVRLTARLQHPSIVSVHEAGVLPGGELVYAMKLVPGRSLREVLREPRTVPQRLALLPIVSAIADALAYAHQQRVIHRDLKPGNVLVGEFGEVVVIDWGLAKDLGDAADDPVGADVAAAAEHTAGAMGTPAYMSPEAARGEPVDERADVYAIGAILYEALTGTAPYRGRDGAAILAAVRAGAPAPIERRARGVPADLAAIVGKAMARDPAARYPTGRELADELRRFQTGQLVSAHAYSLGERALRWLRRHRAPVAVAAAALAVVVALIAVGFSRIVRERDLAAERADRLTLARAGLELERDPAAALATLATLPARSPHWGAARILAADARARGVPTVTAAPGDVVALGFAGAELRVIVRDDAAIRVLGAELAELAVLAQETPPAAIAASADGGTVAVVDGNGTVRVWSIDAPDQPRLERPGPRVGARLAIASDGSAVVTSGRDLGVRAWTVADGVERLRDDGARDVDQLAIAGGAAAIALSRGDQVAVVGPPAPAPTYAAPAAVVALAFAPAGDALAIATADGGVRIERLAGGSSMSVRQDAPASALRFSAGASLLATLAGREVRLWSLDGRPVRTLVGLGSAAAALAIDAGGEAVAAGDAGRTWRWSRLGDDQQRLVGPAAGAVALATAGTVAVTVADDGAVWAWDLARGAGRSLGGHAAPARAVALSADGGHAITAGDDRTVRWWDLATGAGRVLGSHQGAALAVALDGDRAASGGADRAVRLWALGDGAAGRVLGQHAGPVIAVAFSSDRRHLVSIADEPVAIVWDLDGGAARRLDHGAPVTALDIAPDGRTLVTGSRDGAVWLWPLDGGAGRVLTRHGGPVRDVAFSSDGQRVVSASDDGTARVADRRGRVVELVGHDDFVRRAVFSPDGLTVATAGEDGDVRLWDAASGGSRALRTGGWIAEVAFIAGGDRVLAAGADGALWIWRDDLPRARAPLRAAILASAASAAGAR